MMMPANFSVIAENEMTYVCGGAIADWLPDAPSMKTLTSNIVNIVANSYVAKVVGAVLGTMFDGNYFVNGNTVWNAMGNMLTGNNTYNPLNIAMQVLGSAAAVYQLASVAVKTYVPNKIILKDGTNA